MQHLVSALEAVCSSSVFNSEMGKYVEEKAYLKCNVGVDL